MSYLIVPTAWLTYYESRGCPNITPGSKPTSEAEQVVLQGLAGQVPDWYRENITNGAELWAALGPRPVAAGAGQPGRRVRRAVQHGLDHLSPQPGALPPADSNPFKDGGCDAQTAE